MVKLTMKDKMKNNWKLIPLIFILGFEPLIVYMKEYLCNLSRFEWFSDLNDSQVDFFLKYKSYAIITMGITVLISGVPWERLSIGRLKKSQMVKQATAEVQ